MPLVTLITHYLITRATLIVRINPVRQAKAKAVLNQVEKAKSRQGDFAKYLGFQAQLNQASMRMRKHYLQRQFHKPS